MAGVARVPQHHHPGVRLRQPRLQGDRGGRGDGAGPGIPLQSDMVQSTNTNGQSVSRTVTLEMNFPVQDVVDHQAEDVARLNQEISCLREEIERGDRQIKELEQQVTDISSLMEM